MFQLKALIPCGNASKPPGSLLKASPSVLFKRDFEEHQGSRGHTGTRTKSYKSKEASP